MSKADAIDQTDPKMWSQGWLALSDFGSLEPVGSVVAGVTTRLAGDSADLFAALNFATHVGDDEHLVIQHRKWLQQHIGAADIQWLEQVHSNTVFYCDASSSSSLPKADAMWTDQPKVALAILSADCVPVLLWSGHNLCVGAAHAGWRGLCNGVIETLVHQMPVPSDQLNAWIGPCIGVQHYEVGKDVWQEIEQRNNSRPITGALAGNIPNVLPHVSDADKRMVNLAGIAEQCLNRVGVASVVQSKICNFEDTRFYSYRRSQMKNANATTGRMASVIMLT